MFKSSKSLNLKSYPKIIERSIYTMKTINTERESSIQKREVIRIDQQSQTLEYQNNCFYYDEKQLDYENKIQQITAKTNQQGNIETEQNQRKKERKLITKTMYSNYLEEKQKEFIKLIGISLCLVMICVIIFHKKESQQIQSLF